MGEKVFYIINRVCRDEHWNIKSEYIAKVMYEGHDPHDMYIGEIVDIIRK